MVGAAQYLDEEIDWVLSAVVGKKRQSYIQAHFKDKFGRSLNHNQIRYIKNKYGKDPRFNSPLVNTRAPRIAISPKLGGPGEQEGEDEQGTEIDFGSLREDGPSMNTGKRQDELKDGVVPMIRAKRKRGTDDSGDGRSRLIKKITGPKRPELQRDRIPKAVEYETPPQQWNTLDLQLSASHVHSASTPPIFLGHGHHDTQQMTAHDSTQQPMLSQFHSTSSGGWTPFVPLSTWETDSPVCTSVNHSMNPSTLVYPTSTMEQLYHPPAEQTHTLQTPVTTQYELQLPFTHLAASSVSPFLSLTSNITPHPYHSYQEQQYHQTPQRQQDIQLHVEAPENPEFPSLAISEVEGHSTLDTLSSVQFPLIPSFQEMPIEPASSQGVVAEGDVHEHH